MIPDIVGGLITYLEPILATNTDVATFNVYDGEIPRYDTNGNPVFPQLGTASWPAVDLQYQEPGFNRGHTIGTNAADDWGTIVTRVWDVTRAGCLRMMGYIEDALERQISVTEDVDLAGPAGNPNYVIELSLKTYGVWQDPNYRTATSQLLYRGEMYWKCGVHTNAPAID